jgi:hypothetical protein
VCWVALERDVYGTVESRGSKSLSLRVWTRVFHDLHWEKRSLFILSGWSSISIISLIRHSLPPDFLTRILVSWNGTQWQKFMLCLAMADFSGWWSQMCQWWSLVLVSMECCLFNVDLSTLTGDAVNAWHFQVNVILDMPMETGDLSRWDSYYLTLHLDRALSSM